MWVALAICAPSIGASADKRLWDSSRAEAAFHHPCLSCVISKQTGSVENMLFMVPRNNKIEVNCTNFGTIVLLLLTFGFATTILDLILSGGFKAGCIWPAPPPRLGSQKQKKDHISQKVKCK